MEMGVLATDDEVALFLEERAQFHETLAEEYMNEADKGPTGVKHTVDTLREAARLLRKYASAPG